MADYSITFARSARKELEALPNSLIARIFNKIEALSPNLAHISSENCKDLTISGASESVIIGSFIRLMIQPKQLMSSLSAIAVRLTDNLLHTFLREQLLNIYA